MEEEGGPQAHGGDAALAYLRVSTEKQQQDSAGLDQQLDAIQDHASKQGYDLPEHNVFRDIISGARKDREGYYRLLQRIEKQDANVILAYDVDRFGRNNLDNAWLLSKAKEFGFSLETANGHDGDYLADPQSELLFDILSAVAKFERNAILARLRRGKKAAHERGYWPNGRSPWGYTTKGEQGQRLLVPNDNAEYVPQLYEKYLEGASLMDLVAWIRKQDAKKYYKTRPPKKLKASAMFMGRLLDNRAYIGELEYNGCIVQGNHEPIVDRDLWEQVQEQRAKRTN